MSLKWIKNRFNPLLLNPLSGFNNLNPQHLIWIVFITLSLLHSKIAGQEDSDDEELPAPVFCGHLRFETNPVTILNISERQIIDRDVFLKVHKKFANSSVVISNPLCQIQICGFSAGITTVFNNVDNPSPYARCHDFLEADTIVESIPYVDQYEITAISCGCQETADSHHDCHNFDFCSLLPVSPYLCANLYQEEKCRTCTHREIELKRGTVFKTQNSAVITSANVRDNCTLTRMIYGDKFKEKRRQEFLNLGNSVIEPNYYQQSDEYTCNCEDIDITTVTPETTTKIENQTSKISVPLPSNESWNVLAVAISAVVAVLLFLCTTICGVYVYKRRNTFPSTIASTKEGTRDPVDGLLHNLTPQLTFEPFESNGVSFVYDNMGNVSLNDQELNTFKTVKDDSPLLASFAAQIDPKFIINYNHLEFGRGLGSGEFGKVLEGTVNIPELEIVARRVALKPIHYSAIGLDQTECFLSLINEIKVSCHIGKHTNLVEFIGASIRTEGSQGRSCHVLIMELCGEQNLKEYLTSQRPRLRRPLLEVEADPPPPPVPGYVAFAEAQPINRPVIAKIVYGDIDTELFRKLLHFSKGIAAGMDYLHSKDVLHKDLAARNILLSLSENPEPKIADFGSSRKLYGKDYYKQAKGRVALNWIAPEYISESRFIFESDVWAYGVTLWEIFNLGKDPNYPVDQSNMDVFVIGLRNFLRSGKRLQRPEFATKEIYDRIFNCWKYDPKLRPSFKEIQNFFEDQLE